MRRYFSVLLCCACLLIASAAAALTQESSLRSVANDPRVIDAAEAWAQWVEYQLAINNVPGASVGIVYDQDLVLARGLGLANPDTGRAATPDTLYSICSISKLFTSIGIMQLRDAGKVNLDDEIGKHLDWFAITDNHPGDEPTTLRRALTHSAGLPRESDYPYWTGELEFPTHEQIVARVAGQSTLYGSGRYFQYSNLGLTLVGEVIATASGRDYHDYIRGEILDPLGMNDTYTEVPAQHHGEQLAVGHTVRQRDGERIALPLFQANGIAPAAGFASTVEDLARFASWQFRVLGTGDAEDGDDTDSGVAETGAIEVLAPATLRQMQRVHWVDPDWKTTRGLGFAVNRLDDSSVVGHGGGCPGYYSYVAIHPKSKVAAIVLTNAIGPETYFYATKALELVMPETEAAADDPEGAPERDPGLDRYVGIYDTIWGQTAIVRWEDGLASLALNERDPKEALQELRQVGEHTFRRIRTDDKSFGETFVFDVAADGTVMRMQTHSNWAVKVR